MSGIIVIIAYAAFIIATIEFFVIATRANGVAAQLKCTREPARYDDVPY